MHTGCSETIFLSVEGAAGLEGCFIATVLGSQLFSALESVSAGVDLKKLKLNMVNYSSDTDVETVGRGCSWLVRGRRETKEFNSMERSAERNEKSIVGSTMMRIGPLYIKRAVSDRLVVYNLAQPRRQSVRVFLYEPMIPSIAAGNCQV